MCCSRGFYLQVIIERMSDGNKKRQDSYNEGYGSQSFHTMILHNPRFDSCRLLALHSCYVLTTMCHKVCKFKIHTLSRVRGYHILRKQTIQYSLAVSGIVQ